MNSMILDDYYDDEDECYDVEEYEDEDEEVGAGDAGVDVDHETKIPFKVESLTKTEAKAEIDATIANAQQSLPPEMSADAVKIALDLNCWNCEDLICKTFNHPDGEQAYFASLNVPFGPPPETTAEDLNNLDADADNPEKVTCRICSNESLNIHRHRCGADVCLDCWQEYIRSEVVDNNRGNLACPSCPLFLEARLVEELSGDHQIKLRIQSAILESFIQKSKQHSWCPAPNCERIFRIRDPSYEGWKIGDCACGSTSCLDCSKLWHGPMDCHTNTRWDCLVNHKYANTLQWLIVNSKPCPKCTTPIQKTGGCNVMRCSNPSCGYDFCWICLGKAHEHSYGETCSKYKAPTNVVGKVQLTHDWYKHYCARYRNMIDSAEMDAGNQIAAEIQRTKEKLINQGTVTQQLGYMDNIASVLKRSKLTLAHSYALLCLTEDSPERSCFENSLEVFQAKVDGLSYWLEYSMFKITCPEQISSYVRDNLFFCQNRSELIDSTSEYNYKNGIWNFLPEV